MYTGPIVVSIVHSLSRPLVSLAMMMRFFKQLCISLSGRFLPCTAPIFSINGERVSSMSFSVIGRDSLLYISLSAIKKRVVLYLSPLLGKERVSPLSLSIILYLSPLLGRGSLLYLSPSVSRVSVISVHKTGEWFCRRQ